MRNCWRSADATARSTTCRCGRATTPADGGSGAMMSTRPTTTNAKTAAGRAAAGRRRLASRRRRDLRQGLRPATSCGASGRFVQPYRRQICISVAAVLVFTLTQLAIPLIIRYAIDNGMAAGGPTGASLLWSIAAFAVVDPHQLRRQLCPGDRGRQGGRERALRHAPRDVRAPAARLAELHGQDRGRPADVAAAGRRQLDAGVPRDLGALGRRHRAAVRHRRRAAAARLAARAADARR